MNLWCFNYLKIKWQYLFVLEIIYNRLDIFHWMYIYKGILKKEIQRINSFKATFTFIFYFLEEIELIKMQKNSRNEILKILIFWYNSKLIVKEIPSLRSKIFTTCYLQSVAIISLKIIMKNTIYIKITRHFNAISFLYGHLPRNDQRE